MMPAINSGNLIRQAMKGCELWTRLNNISSIVDEALLGMDSDKFLKAAGDLSNNKDNIRERIQNITVSEIKDVIGKLKRNKALTQEDLQCMRLWIASDAESYTKMGNSFNDWLSEFERLKNVLEEYEGKDLSRDEFFNIQGILEDAIRVAADIGNFLEKKERIRRFDEVTQSLQSLDRGILVEVLEQKIKSPEF